MSAPAAAGALARRTGRVAFSHRPTRRIARQTDAANPSETGRSVDRARDLRVRPDQREVAGNLGKQHPHEREHDLGDDERADHESLARSPPAPTSREPDEEGGKRDDPVVRNRDTDRLGKRRMEPAERSVHEEQQSRDDHQRARTALWPTMPREQPARRERAADDVIEHDLRPHVLLKDHRPQSSPLGGRRGQPETGE